VSERNESASEAYGDAGDGEFEQGETAEILPSAWDLSRRRQRWGLIGFEVLLTPIALVGGWLLGTHPLETLQADINAVLVGTVATLPVLWIVVIGIALPGGPMRSIERLIETYLIPIFRHWTFGELVVVSIAAGIGEELLFRGVVQAAVARWTVPWAGLLVGAIVFGLVHFLSPLYFVFATLMGLYLGGLWLWSGNLMVPVVTHAVYDLAVLVYLTRVRGAGQRVVA